MHSNNPPKLYYLIKVNAVLCALYFGFRAAVLLDYCTDTPAAAIAAVFVVCALAGFYLSVNIWSKRGLLFLSFVLMLAATDVICFVTAGLFGGFENSTFMVLWAGGVFCAAAYGLFLLYGLYNERRVVKNTLTASSPKLHEQCRLAVLSDLHFGTIQPAKILTDTIQRINSEKFDGVILVGDIVDERTSKESLKLLFTELAALETTYGTFFVHGNHDRQECRKGDRTFTDSEFDTLMKEAGIRNIDDTVVNLGDSIQLIGRKDYSFNDRMDVAALLAGSDPSKFRIVAEHQPADCEELSEQGVDICLSAHYHGAQNWPNNLIYSLAGIRYMGEYRIGSMILYVNSGLAGSKYRIRTHGHCEYLELKLG